VAVGRRIDRKKIGARVAAQERELSYLQHACVTASDESETKKFKLF
jgi:hypothetical protein